MNNYCDKQIVRNRRFTKLNILKQQGYYEQQQVMLRYPKLYYQFVGKYKNSRQKGYTKMSQFFQAQALNSEYRRLLTQQNRKICEMDEQNIDGQQLINEQQQMNIKYQDLQQFQEIAQQDLQLQEQALLEHLQTMFLDGLDPTASYQQIDNNSDLDNQKQKDQDQQQRYFAGVQQDENYKDAQNNIGIQDF